MMGTVFIEFFCLACSRTDAQSPYCDASGPQTKAFEGS